MLHSHPKKSAPCCLALFYIDVYERHRYCRVQKRPLRMPKIFQRSLGNPHVQPACWGFLILYKEPEKHPKFLYSCRFLCQKQASEIQNTIERLQNEDVQSCHKEACCSVLPNLSSRLRKTMECGRWAKKRIPGCEKIHTPSYTPAGLQLVPIWVFGF